MISRSESPAEWSLLMYELEDASEHLASLISALSERPDMSEEDFKVHLGHVYSHLNRAWHRRNLRGELTDAQWELASEFPSDLKPV